MSQTDSIVARIMSIRNGMILDADAEAIIRREIGLDLPQSSSAVTALANKIEEAWRWESRKSNGAFVQSLSTDEQSLIVTALRAQRPAVTDEMVEMAWAGIVGRDVATTCHQASIIRADLKAGLEAALKSRGDE
jgi:hypothetical protein